MLLTHHDDAADRGDPVIITLLVSAAPARGRLKR